MAIKSKTPVQNLLSALDNHIFLKRDYPEVLEIIANYLEMEKIHIASAWNEGNWLAKNGFTSKDYSNGKEYFEHVYDVNDKCIIKES